MFVADSREKNYKSVFLMQEMEAKTSLLVVLLQNYKLQPKNHRKDAWTYPVSSAYFDLIFQFQC